MVANPAGAARLSGAMSPNAIAAEVVLAVPVGATVVIAAKKPCATADADADPVRAVKLKGATAPLAIPAEPELAVPVGAVSTMGRGEQTAVAVADAVPVGGFVLTVGR